jgi:2-polyprenyl-3-methyl-5-hydroxy-6-metoxy-1,4-benzoquinol methylase
MSEGRACRFCRAALHAVALDLGMSPIANAYERADDLDRPAMFYPLRVLVCGECGLVQLPELVAPEQLFAEYSYFSSYSTTWVEHARRFAERFARTERIGPESLVVEIASNDGYLLEHFARAGARVLGVEPARNVARVAQERGINTLPEFFGLSVARRLAAEAGPADLVVANNVLAHVPDLNDFVAGLAALLADEGLASIEFPHLLRTVEQGEFDQFYHEHYSYFTLSVAERVFAAHGLRVVDAEELPTHGGSLRLHVRHEARGAAAQSIEAIKARERAARLDTAAGFAPLAQSARCAKHALLDLLIRCRREGKKAVGYGAPAKAATLLNFCGIRVDLLPFTVDKSPHKQGRFIPGVRVPIDAPERIVLERPDVVVIFPWNIAGEIVEEMAMVRGWGGRFVVPVPEVREL